MKRAPHPWVLLAFLALGLLVLSGCQRPKDQVVGRQASPTSAVVLAQGTPPPTEPGTVTIGIETPQTGISVTQAAGESGSPEISSGGGITPAGAEASPAPATETVATAVPEPTTVTVETGPSAATPETGPAAAAAGQTVSYTVQRGDTLYSIARRYDTTVEDIRAENNLSSNFIYVGQVLHITPGPGAGTSPTPGPGTGGTYVVQRGDTLIGIARRFNTTVEALARANNLTSPYVIYVGQTLTIPGGTGSAATATPATGQQQIYTVQRGDTLYSIARRYNTTVEAIRQANGLSSNLIYVGQKLVIP
ncbi:MAG: LysM peptidoglycan-binding domain-containing protein [Ardenticatenaceae bacterium]|nr:LysM peptidoglycan-binding domain-containing protein [Ardenticatenaceae bacterium]HBY96631.1 hypothetical protein [Chloroflexota bacterium]